MTTLPTSASSAAGRLDLGQARRVRVDRGGGRGCGRRRRVSALAMAPVRSASSAAAAGALIAAVAVGPASRANQTAPAPATSNRAPPTNADARRQRRVRPAACSPSGFVRSSDISLPSIAHRSGRRRRRRRPCRSVGYAAIRVRRESGVHLLAAQKVERVVELLVVLGIRRHIGRASPSARCLRVLGSGGRFRLASPLRLGWLNWAARSGGRCCVDHDVGLDALGLDRAAGRRVVARRGQAERAVAAERDDRLHRALAEASGCR